MLAFSPRMQLICLTIITVLAAGCSTPEDKFERFVQDFSAEYSAHVTAGDELINVTGEVEVFNGVNGTLKYTVRRQAETGETEEVVIQVDYKLRENKWQLVRTFPLHEGEMRELHRERTEEESVSALLIKAANY